MCFRRKNTCRKGRNRGVTMLELSIALVVLGVLVGLAVPLTLNVMINSRINGTRDQLKNLQRAIVGDDALGTFGFVGDMGRLPESLDQLLQRGNQPIYSTAHTYAIGMGWNGPYLLESGSDALKDAFGNKLDYGVVGKGQIRSAGADGDFGTADDLVYPSEPLNVLGRVHVEVLRPRTDGTVQRDPPGVMVRVYYCAGASESSIVATHPPFVFEDLVRGVHAVRVMPTVVGEESETVNGTIALARVLGNNQTQYLQVTIPAAVAGGASGGSTNQASGVLQQLLQKP